MSHHPTAVDVHLASHAARLQHLLRLADDCPHALLGEWSKWSTVLRGGVCCAAAARASGDTTAARRVVPLPGMVKQRSKETKMDSCPCQARQVPFFKGLEVIETVHQGWGIC